MERNLKGPGQLGLYRKYIRQPGLPEKQNNNNNKKELS